MSALDVYDEQKQYQIENSPFSETFIIDPSGAAIERKGIFDNSYNDGSKDEGNMYQKQKKIRILLYDLSDITFKTTEIQVRGVTYVAEKSEDDANGISVVWLL